MPAFAMVMVAAGWVGSCRVVEAAAVLAADAKGAGTVVISGRVGARAFVPAATASIIGARLELLWWPSPLPCCCADSVVGGCCDAPSCCPVGWDGFAVASFSSFSAVFFEASSSSLVTTGIPCCLAIIHWTCREYILTASSLTSLSCSTSVATDSSPSLLAASESSESSISASRASSMSMSSPSLSFLSFSFSFAFFASSSASFFRSLSYSSCAARATDRNWEYRRVVSGSFRKRAVWAAEMFFWFAVPCRKNPGSSPRASRSAWAFRRSSGEMAMSSSPSSEELPSSSSPPPPWSHRSRFFRARFVRSVAYRRATRTSLWAYSLARVLTTTVMSPDWPGATTSERTGLRRKCAVGRRWRNRARSLLRWERGFVAVSGSAPLVAAACAPLVGWEEGEIPALQPFESGRC
mmetsp:Transcript_17787/g.40649  ORF Transcript_17787/g.40649 Transcript_17787/m.40649 type:complete len:409 (-) Transcript_17787:45-1271(-)